VCLKVPLRDLIAVKSVKFEPMIDAAAKWQNVFTLFTLQRHFRLYAASTDDRNKWVKSFETIIGMKS